MVIEFKLGVKMSTALTQSTSPSLSKPSGLVGLPSAVAKHTTLPPISPSPPPKSSGGSSKNPFIMPPTNELFSLREKERQVMKTERARERQLKAHEKSTYASRLNAKTAELRKQALTPESQRDGTGKEAGIHEDTQFVLATTRDRQIEKEDLTSYVARKREMFLVQYALGVKRDEIKKLEEIAKAEERKLQAAEKYLEESATMFDEFLKENDKNAVEAIKMAEAATKGKLEKVAEIKRLNAQLITIKNEISRNNETLSELQTYKQFLDSLAPQESLESMLSAKSTTKTQLSFDNEAAVEFNPDDDDVTFPFVDPAGLIGIFTELEEQNLSLIQNSQDTEETLEDMRQSQRATEKKMNRETENLKRQIEQLKGAIAREEDKAYDLEIKAKMYSYGEYKAEDQELMLAQLDKKVADVYVRCIGPNEANIPTIQMLAAIESRLEELFDTVEALPHDMVEAAEKSKEKERRLRLREEKLEEQRLAQEERLRRALERAQADPKKRMGRRLVYRSDPPVLKRKQKEQDELKDREEEEHLYFFS